MVISRASSSHQPTIPCIKEVTYVAMVPSANTRTLTHRISELPSLRYGSLGAQCTTSGPLRVSHHQQYNNSTGGGHWGANHNDGTAVVRTAISTNGRYRRTFPADSGTRTLPRTARRVRFDLPSDVATLDGDDDDNNNGDATTSGSSVGHSAKLQQQVAGVGSWLRSRCGNTASVSSSSASSVDNHRIVKQRSQLVHNTGRYVRGTLSPTANTTAAPFGHGAATPYGPHALLRAAKDSDDILLKDILKRGLTMGIPETELNALDSSGRTPVSYIVSNGSVDMLEYLLQHSAVDVNRADNEGNTPLHFAAQAGQVECLNYLLSRCTGIEVDARNNLGFTPLMKAAIQGRNKCAKLLLFAGASPTMRDTGRGLRAEQWARFCGRYVCAEVIEKFARHRLLERSTSNGRWGSEPDIGARVLMGKVVPQPVQITQPHHSTSIKSKIRKVFRTSSGPGHNNHPTDSESSARLVTQLTTAALCASTPVLPAGPAVPPVVKSLIRPLTVPKLQVTLVNNNGDVSQTTNLTNGMSRSQPNLVEQLQKEDSRTIGANNSKIKSKKKK